MHLSNVDLPEPEEPIKTVAVCSGTLKEISSRTISLPKALRSLYTIKISLIKRYLEHSVAQLTFAEFGQ